MLFRRAEPKDLDAIHALSLQSGHGITTLPKDKTLLQSRLEWSAQSFSKSLKKPENEYYLFLLEDTSTGKVVGTSAIESAIGHDVPFYSYKLCKQTRVCHSLMRRSDYEVLMLVNDNQERSELCTLFLEPNYRINGHGLLLSRARFLFIAEHPQRFSKTIIAEMRGISDDDGNSPFWDNLGQHFFHMSFMEADQLTLSSNKQFIADLMPRNPIYVSLLPKIAQEVIGKPHPSTLSAMSILLREGFHYNGYVDIFDGGPTIEALSHHIQTIHSHHILRVSNLSDEVSSKRFILANTSLNFRATISQVIFNPTKDTCILSKETADRLQINVGDCIRLAPLYPDDSKPFYEKQK